MFPSKRCTADAQVTPTDTGDPMRLRTTLTVLATAGLTVVLAGPPVRPT